MRAFLRYEDRAMVVVDTVAQFGIETEFEHRANLLETHYWFRMWHEGRWYDVEVDWPHIDRPRGFIYPSAVRLVLHHFWSIRVGMVDGYYGA